MLLTELFKSDEKFVYDVRRKTNGLFLATMRAADGSRLEFTAKRMESTEGQPWDMAFSRNGSMDKTGDGGEIDVFKRITFLIREFAEIYKPNYVTMSADGSNRANLYKRMLKRANPSWKTVKYLFGADNHLLASIDAKELPIGKENGGWGVYVGELFVGYEKDGKPNLYLKYAKEEDLKQIEPELEKVRKEMDKENAA